MKSFDVVIVVARFNQIITNKLLEGAVSALEKNNIKKDSIKILWVPGAFELAIASKLAINKYSPKVVISLGAVIRGGTPHFEYVCNETARGINEVALTTNTPIIFGVLTTDNLEQALDRVKEPEHKGIDAGLAAIDMMNLLD